MSAYADAYSRSMADPQSFWLEAAEAIDWYEKPGRALDDSEAPFFNWFPDGVLNTCYNALDRHVAQGNGDRLALVWESAMANRAERYTYADLLDLVSRFAGALRNLGVGRGDRVLIYMPMVPEAAIAMLACARLGAIHSVVFGGFAAPELASRIDDAEPTVIVAASCGLEPGRVVEYTPIIRAALEKTRHRPDSTIILQRKQSMSELGEGEFDWDAVISAAEPVECEPVMSTDPLYILYTSGTTGKPKGVVRDNGGHAVALAWSLTNVYNVQPGETMWAASDVGWQVGHTYTVYGPLICGATTVMFEGKPVGTPDAGAFWRIIEKHKVKVLLTAPTAIRAIKRVDPDGKCLAGHDISSLETLFLAGERLDPDTYSWAGNMLGVPVVDHWWQTETGWPACANLRGLEPMALKPGSPSVPVPGFDIRVLSSDGNPVQTGTEGMLCIKLPQPPGMLSTLWKDKERYREAYLSRFDGYYLTGDSGLIDEDGYVFVLGRTDDVINVAGHRLSTGVLEAVLAAHPAVAECAVIGVPDALKGQVARGFVVLKSGAGIAEDTLRQEIIASVRAEVGPVAAFRELYVVDGLPKTRSGKILRRSMRAIAEGRDEALPATIENPEIFTSLSPILQGSHTNH
ncbi:propionyl-CoA synthetase [Paenarthrobacter nitroguajacolicus]|uniref:propionyl-CoA synthetase n=1 Tax=Paenarthrobacter nitroguajacolicus TaxID=211146 RepID=UPI00248BBA3F|nr:propionyl-CoA synthetase [Paenarthrobacter nitroguajacolicus]MDI2035589.1 Acetyl-coenzyme A synthetase [Paenarthrobacter nitroguajacolicus]